MKKFIATIFIMLSGLVYAGNSPILSADAIPKTEPVPAVAEYNVNGGPWITCAITGTTTKVPKCDLSNITVPGTYKLLLRYTWKAECAAGGAGPCWGQGDELSDPFTYKWLGVPALKPKGLKIVTQ